VPKYDRDILLKDLRQNAVEIHYRKVDGTMRVAHATLMPKLVPAMYMQENVEAEEEFHKENPDVITYWDLQKNDWRSFRIASVYYANLLDNYV
jgi:hypothetical protein